MDNQIMKFVYVVLVMMTATQVRQSGAHNVREKIYAGLSQATAHSPQGPPTHAHTHTHPETPPEAPEINPEAVEGDSGVPQGEDLGPDENEIEITEQSFHDDPESTENMGSEGFQNPHTTENMGSEGFQDPHTTENMDSEGFQDRDTTENRDMKIENGDQNNPMDPQTTENMDTQGFQDPDTTDNMDSEGFQDPDTTENWDVMVVCLGGGEDNIVMTQIAGLLYAYGHKVAAIVYGPEPREEIFPTGVKVLKVPVALEDPLYPGGVVSGITPGEEEGVEWVSGRVISSRLWACRQVMSMAWVKDTVGRAKLVVSPLFLHDLCVLSLAEGARVPVVGVVTSRVGAWWVWEQLGVLPPLATTPVPPTTMQEPTIWARAANLARHYGYLSALRQQYQAPALTALATQGTPPPLDTLYASLNHVLLAWDALVDAHMPSTPLVVPIGGFAFETGRMTKDVLVPALLNRAGVVSVCPGGGEAWVGAEVLHALYHALSTTPYTVLWRTSYPHLRPNVTQEEGENSGEKFIFKRLLPLSDVLNHPRHRLLVSTCGETEVMAAVYFGSPVLCLPVTTDQTLAAAALENLGLAVVVPAKEASTQRLKEALRKLAGDRSYRERGRQLGEELHDQPLSPADRVLFTLERVMRKPGSKRHIKKASNLYLLQQSNADVYLLLLILLTCLSGLLMFLAIILLPILLKKQKTKAD